MTLSFVQLQESVFSMLGQRVNSSEMTTTPLIHMKWMLMHVVLPVSCFFHYTSTHVAAMTSDFHRTRSFSSALSVLKGSKVLTTACQVISLGHLSAGERLALTHLPAQVSNVALNK